MTWSSRQAGLIYIIFWKLLEEKAAALVHARFFLRFNDLDWAGKFTSFQELQTSKLRLETGLQPKSKPQIFLMVRIIYRHKFKRE